MTSILLHPKMTFEEFKVWFENEPIWHRIQLENVTARDTGKVKKNIIGNASSIFSIYNNWYLERHIDSK